MRIPGDLNNLCQTMAELPVSVLITDSSGTIEYINQRFSVVSGYSLEQVKGKTPRVLKSGIQTPEIYQQLWATILAGQEWRGELANRAHNGDLYWERLRISPIFDANDEICYFLAIADDISAQKQLEQRLNNRIKELMVTRRTMLNMMEDLEESRQAAEAAAITKDHFLANMSHEIRTPMNAIIGMTHLALKNSPSEKQAAYLHKIDIASKGLLGIINDILDFSKIEAGQLEMDQVTFSLQTLLRDVSDTIGDSALEKGLRFQISLHPEVPHNLCGDPLRLKQVLLNLIGNAIKFTPQGEVAVAVALADKREKGVVIRFHVTDSGIGLRQDQIAQLFHPFHQADSSTTRQYGGTGLGLSICHNLVERMGGEIQVESTPGQGSRFSFTATFNPSSLSSPCNVKRGRTLVVEEREEARHDIVKTVTPYATQLVEATSAQQAAEALYRASEQGEPFELMVINQRLYPIASGTPQHLSNTIPIEPIVILIGSTTGTKISAIGPDADRSIHPTTLPELEQTLLTLLSNAALQSTAPDDLTLHHYDRLPEAHILLVEDSEINQQVACELLEQQRCRVEVAATGEAALTALQQGGFDLILMDIQMPVLDGLSATRRIRQLDNDTANIPIIAMTAHAMRGDRERCLAAGMNDYITKPLDPQQLYSTVQRWLPLREHTPPPPVQVAWVDDDDSPPLTTLPGIATEEGLARLRGRRKVYWSLLRGFYLHHQGSVAEIRTALQQIDGPLAQRLAHTLKGVAATIGALEVQQHAAELEATISEAEFDAAARLLPTLDAHLQRVIAGLHPLMDQQQQDEERQQPTQTGTTSHLQGYLIQLLEPLQARKPKPSSAIMVQMNSLIWPEDYTLRLVQLNALIEGYQLKQAADMVLGLLNGLTTDRGM